MLKVCETALCEVCLILEIQIRVSVTLARPASIWLLWFNKGYIWYILGFKLYQKGHLCIYQVYLVHGIMYLVYNISALYLVFTMDMEQVLKVYS